LPPRAILTIGPQHLNRQLLLRLPISCRVRKERRYRESINLAVRIEFTPNSTTAWFTSVMAIINNITMPGDHPRWRRLFANASTAPWTTSWPITLFEIAMSKVWANGLVITVAVGLSLYGVVRTFLGVPIAGSIPLFLSGVMICLLSSRPRSETQCTISIAVPTANAHANCKYP